MIWILVALALAIVAALEWRRQGREAEMGRVVADLDARLALMEKTLDVKVVSAHLKGKAAVKARLLRRGIR